MSAKNGGKHEDIENSPLLASNNQPPPGYDDLFSDREVEPTTGGFSGLYPQANQADVSFTNTATTGIDESNVHQQPTAPSGTLTAEVHDNSTFDDSEDTSGYAGPTVQCRVCEAEITLDGKTGQHVVRCLQCNEVTPIRPAPPGKKYVRCPCNCLLVCRAKSTRIACPRQNCRRVITLASGPPNAGIPGTAIRAPVGTCRVQCAYCQEIFMFNTLNNQLAICPHCRKSSSVGTRFSRSRCIINSIGLFFVSMFLIGLIIAISNGQNNFFMWVFLIALSSFLFFLTYRLVYFWRIGISQVLGPL